MKKLTRAEYENTCTYKTKLDCPFCDENIRETHEVLYETEYWFVLFAKYPYFDIEGEHLLLVPKEHIEFTADLSEEAFIDMKNVEKWIQSFYKNIGKEYFSFIRQSRSNKSVEHLHYHYLPGVPGSRLIDGEKYIKIKRT